MAVGEVGPPSWSFIDALVLASVVLIQDGEEGDLAALIGTADYIDRIILGRDEIESAVSALAGCSLLVAHEQLTPTEAARSLWATASKGRGMWAAVENLRVRLDKVATRPLSPEPWTLAEKDYEAAVRENRRRFAASRKSLDDDPGSRT
jgi:hypothetical protein